MPSRHSLTRLINILGMQRRRLFKCNLLIMCIGTVSPCVFQIALNWFMFHWQLFTPRARDRPLPTGCFSVIFVRIFNFLRGTVLPTLARIIATQRRLFSLNLNSCHHFDLSLWAQGSTSTVCKSLSWLRYWVTCSDLCDYHTYQLNFVSCLVTCASSAFYYRLHALM